MYTWFSDLDNTLIYSHRVSLPSDKVLAEYLNGKEQSYMTKESLTFLSHMAIDFVPVTTRSIEQYKRIFLLGDKIAVKHALVCNGAVLLEDGKADQEWLGETRKIARTQIRELHQIRERLDGYEIKEAEDMFFYFKSAQPQAEAERLNRLYKGNGIFIGFDARKVYCIPSCINKGNAIKRYCERFGGRRSIASGDSDFDLPMLNAADIAVAPDKLIDKIDGKGKKIPLGNAPVISDSLCRQISNIIEELR